MEQEKQQTYPEAMRADELFQKVTKGLQCISLRNSMKDNPCAGCAYEACVTFAICVQRAAADALELIERQEKELKRLRMDKEELLREVNRKVTISVGHGAGWEYYFRKYKGAIGPKSLEMAIKRDLKEQLIEFCDDHGYIVYRQENARFIEAGEKLTASMTVLLPQGVERTLPDGIVKIKEEGYHGAGEAADLHGGNDGSAEGAAGGQAGNAGGAHAGHCGGCEACQCDGEEKCVSEE